MTVYREGSREGILQTEGQADKQEAPVVEIPDSLGPDGFRHRRRRPAVTTGITERINTGEGKIYVTINEDEYGICEIFSTIGKAGGNAAAQSEAISRLISLALRSGVDPQEVISELKGISGPSPVWEDGELILSTPDAIGKAMERYLQRKAGKQPDAVASENVPPSSAGSEPKTLTTCPECGSTVAYESSCLMCKHCGWSKC
ncbi:MAG: TSCPD domain-containing protein [Candidatus Latescibacteria bacterium]|nr:TSCPD domain-containing protein [Candidatus Latescibacterota bacterium]